MNQMAANNIKQTPALDARLFEYSVLLGDKSKVSNDLLARLTDDRTESLSPIDSRYLSRFFE